jgi:hypothetical protein
MLYNHNAGPKAVGTWGVTSAGGLQVGGASSICGIFTEALVAGNSSGIGIASEDASGNFTWLPQTNFVLTNAANTFTAAGTLDLHLSTNANGFKLPSIAGCSPTLGSLCFDVTTGNYEISSTSVALVQSNTGNVQNSLMLYQNVGGGTLVAAPSSIIDAGAGVVLPSTVTGGAKGAGTLNAAGLYVNGTAVQLSNGTIPLSGVVSPTGAITEIQDGDNALFVSSATSTAGRVAVEFGEHTASTSTGTAYELQALTLAGSTAIPFNATNSLNGSQTLPTVNITPTWNTTGSPTGALTVAVTNTASSSGGKVLNLLIGAAGSTNFFNVQTQSGVVATAALNGPNIALGGSQPTLTAPGTTPYLNNQILTKGTANTCTFALTTGTFTLALSPVSLCTYTLPNKAVTWYWSCTAGWSNPAGTTPTFAVGVTWAQAPTTAFQMADIYTTNAGVGTEGVTSTTTNSNILATGTITNSATIFQTQFSGTFTGSATSGTFSPTVSLTGTGATGTMVGGCEIQ